MSISGYSSLPAQGHVHTVQFYGDDNVLFHELKRYLGSALTNGSSAVVIATQGHLNNLAHTLNRSGFSLARATDEGRYIALEASEVISKQHFGCPERSHRSVTSAPTTSATREVTAAQTQWSASTALDSGQARPMMR